MTAKSPSLRTPRPTGHARPVAPARKRGKAGMLAATASGVYHVPSPPGGVKRGAAKVAAGAVRSAIAHEVRREVGRQLRVFGVAPQGPRADDDTLRAVRAYAHEVFGSAAKADRWLERPSVKLGGESPVAWLRDHDDPAEVYSALDAIAYGAPV